MNWLSIGRSHLLFVFLTAMIAGLYACIVFGADGKAAKGNRSDEQRENPEQLLQKVVANELKTHQSDEELWRYRQTRQVGTGSEELEFVETPKGDLHRLLAKDGRPLSPEETRKEDARIRNLVASPEALQKQMKDGEQDSEEARRLLAMLPAAFEYRFIASENNLVKLAFTPRPSFRPQRREGTVFHDMEGIIWVDPSQLRIAGMEGRLVNEVKFGGGILGHLAKGGTFTMKRRDVGDGHWEITRLEIDMDGKALLFKTISVRHSERNSDFQRVDPGITPEQASELLRKEATGAG